MFTPQQLDFLQALTRGERSRAQWIDWLIEHGRELQSQMERRLWLRLKFRPYDTAREILERENRTYGIGLAFFEKCAGEVLNVVPNSTTQKQIRAWVVRHNKTHLVEIRLVDNVLRLLIHPGRYCPAVAPAN